MVKKRLPWLGPGFVAGAFVPLVVLVELVWTGQLGANPISVVLNQLGFVAMVLLIGSLACTPLKMATGWKWLPRIRKSLGVMGFVYALLHFLVYISLDQSFDLKTILEDISKRPFIIIGFVSLLMLVPLAATSPVRASRRLGKNWKRLHRTAYIISPLVIVHFTMRMKADLTQPVIYGAILSMLLLIRVAAATIKFKNAPAWSGFRKFKIVKKEFEPGQVCSFYLKPEDGRKLSTYRPGQYLTLEVVPDGTDNTVIRCYSLSDRPDSGRYRISIKRVHLGTVSNFFHDRVMEGDVINVKAPKGRFYLKSTTRRPVVMVGGGIGITPLLSILDALTVNRSRGSFYFFFGVRNSSEHCFREQLADIASRNSNLKVHICYSAPLPEDLERKDYNSTGHITVSLLKEMLPSLDCEFYVCGPAPMMSQMKTDLASAGVPKENFHMEAFEPASTRKVARPDGATERYMVTFEMSGKTLEWDPKYSSILELAEAHGIDIECSCRAGNCGSCEVQINAGEVDYAIEPGADPGEDACLTCVTVPKTDLSLDA